MMWHSQDGMGWWMLFGGVLWLFFWISVVILIVRAFGDRSHHHHDAQGAEDPVAIARRRLASGEITPAEFQEIVRHLRSAPG